MPNWIIQMDVLWCTKDSKKLVTFKLGAPQVEREDGPIIMEFVFLHDGRPLFHSKPSPHSDYSMGVCPGQAKQLAIEWIEKYYKAEITDLEGNPIDLRHFIPVLLDDYNMERVPPPGHPTGIDWLINRECQWVTKEGAEKFQLKIARPRVTGSHRESFEISASHFLMGDMLLPNHSGWMIKFFADFAQWYDVEILDEDGNSINFESIAEEIQKIEREGFASHLYALVEKKRQNKKKKKVK